MNVISLDGFTFEEMTLVEARPMTSQTDVISGLEFRFKRARKDTILKRRISNLYTFNQSVVRFLL